MGDAFRLVGMKLRDEFVCPITYSLLRDPYVARDGIAYKHTIHA